MARKSDGTTTPRRKKAAAPAETAAVQPAAEQVTSGARVSEARSNVTPINVAPVKPLAKKPAVTGNVDLEEEIRRRAYELFLERNGEAGDPNADWLTAEREVRARHATKEAAAAASQRS
jgi:hypothetical protein